MHRETRPHLFFFNFIESAAAVGQMETDAIGGTWGKATSVLSGGVSPKNEVVKKLLKPHLDSIPENGKLMASYVIKYFFNDLYDHAEEVGKVCALKSRLAYVIGNSKFFNNPLPSDEILADVFGHFGFVLDRLERMRKRQSKSEIARGGRLLEEGLVVSRPTSQEERYLKLLLDPLEECSSLTSRSSALAKKTVFRWSGSLERMYGEDPFLPLDRVGFVLASAEKRNLDGGRDDDDTSCVRRFWS